MQSPVQVAWLHHREAEKPDSLAIGSRRGLHARMQVETAHGAPDAGTARTQAQLVLVLLQVGSVEVGRLQLPEV